MNYTHLNENQSPTMVDVSNKIATHRYAAAESIIYLGETVAKELAATNWTTKKGPIFDTAIIAGTFAAKKTAELIPFCHQLNLKSVKIEIKPFDKERLRIEAQVKVMEQTGVEMEALTTVTVAALTLYDMCKSASKEIVIESTRLIEKTGGKSDLNFRLDTNSHE